MPRDLPGFYWDSQRNRYFPISSRPQAAGPSLNHGQGTPQNTSKKRKLASAAHRSSQKARIHEEESESESESTHTSTKTRQYFHPWSLSQSSSNQNPSSWVSRERITKQILSWHFGTTTQLTYNHAAALGKVTTFATCLSEDPLSVEGRVHYHLLGDNRGWLFRCKAYADVNSRFEESFQPTQGDSQADYNRLPWSPELNLQPNGFVSSISMWGSRWVATGAGTSARFASSDITSLDRMFIVTLPGARDLWTSHLREKSIVLGASFRAIYIPDIDHSNSPEQLNTHSDVFAVTQDQHLIYTGSRNGSVHRFDKRIGLKQRGDLLFDSRFPDSQQRSSVLNMNLLSGADEQNCSTSRTMEFGLLLSQMDGKLTTGFTTSSYKLLIYGSPQQAKTAFGAPNPSYATMVTSTGTRGTWCVTLLESQTQVADIVMQGLAVDYSNGFIYAAGQDCRIRGWSLDSGEPILPFLAPEFSNTVSSGPEPLMPVFSTSALLPANSMTPNPPTTTGQSDTSSSISPWKCYNPFLSQFPDYIPVLRVTSDAEVHYPSSSGDRDTGQDAQELASNRRGQELVGLTPSKTSATCLWAAGRTDLWKWNLGQRR